MKIDVSLHLQERNNKLRFGTKDYTFFRIYILHDYTAMQLGTFVRCGITKGTRESFRLAGVFYASHWSRFGKHSISRKKGIRTKRHTELKAWGGTAAM